MRGLFLLCLLLLSYEAIQGLFIGGKRRCLCLQRGSNFVKPKSIAKIEVFPRSSSCQNMEIIITLKPSGMQSCLNPKSVMGRKILAGVMKKRF
uniref:C-X-C motif chemokine n=1 Tax=Geotrypetes seraphini TaxID=260995 RepID=A0A6P8SDM2_GEOSA|nr:C-X-C motif chemokine 10-like [Geotrypetes seraphini]